MLIPVSPDLFFKGRPGDIRLGEWIATSQSDLKDLKKKTNRISIFGCPDDTGVRLNYGRTGAKNGPQEIRRAFYKMALPMDEAWTNLQVLDCGDIPISDDIEETHKNAFNIAQDLSRHGEVVVLLGGGHDFAAPGFLGFASGRRSLNKSERFGLINIDPHLDVRERENGKPHSGTPFREILHSRVVEGANLIQFGCRENRNSKSHFDFCRELNVSLQPLDQIRQHSKSPLDIFQKSLRRLSKKVGTVGITLDLDCCADLIGTSAAPAIGFSIRELYDIAYFAGSQPNVTYFELAEVAPSLDPSGKTALAAAEILYSFLNGKASLNKSNFLKKR